MHPRLPTAAVVLGIAGLIPFVVLAIAALSARNPSDAARFLLALVAYGGVVLAFLGGIHWGFVLHPVLPEGLAPDARRDATRLGLGIVPSLIGWAALLTPVFGVPEVGLAVLIVGYLGTVIGEHHLRRRGALMPTGYMALRWALSIVVLAVLITVLVLRLIGATITFP